MKSNVFTESFLMLFFFFMASILPAQNIQYGVVMEESFEQGCFPDGWSQENLVGSQRWLIVGGDTIMYPSFAADGNSYLFFSNREKMTNHSVTRIITPVLKLDGYFQPVLCFSRAQLQWAGDCDELNIYYKTSHDAPWILLEQYKEETSGWVRDTIDLTGTLTGYYQLAFEGTDVLGRGIALDDIVIRSKPNCTLPGVIFVSDVNNSSVSINWNATFDATGYEIKIGNNKMDVESLEKENDLILDTVLTSDNTKLNVVGLQSGSYYYAYLRAVCGTEYSEWSRCLEIATSNLQSVPYSENFDLPYTAGYDSRLKYWYYGTSLKDSYIPFVNTSTNTGDRYSLSPDGSTLLMFSDGTHGLIPAGEYAYAATPQMDVDDISKIWVSFTGVKGVKPAPNNSIIVGVMTDPTDIHTFVGVDTVTLGGRQKFERFYISFSRYSGQGKYIAFMSDFEYDNRFYIENLDITLGCTACAVSDVKFSIRSADVLTVTWNTQQASEAEVLVSREKADPNNITAENTASRGVSVSGNYVATGLTPWSEYYVYVRLKCDAGYGQWSEAYRVRMPARMKNIPQIIDFEIDENDKSSYYVTDNAQYGDKMCRDLLVRAATSKDPYAIYAYEAPTESSKYYLVMSVDNAKDSYYSMIVFPEVENPSLYRLRYWYETDPVNQDLEFGVIDDLEDISTFKVVATDRIDAPGWKRGIVSFAGYEGTGHFIAVRGLPSKDIDAYVENIYRLDDVIIEKIPDCHEPNGFVVDAGEVSAKISWKACGMKQWEIRVSETECYDSLDSDTYTSWVFNSIVNDSVVEIPNLKDNQTEYYYYIRAVCDGGNSMWSYPNVFKTECRVINTLPYQMNFDGYVRDYNYDFSVPCLYINTPFKSGFYSYPYMNQGTKYNGDASVAMKNLVDDSETKVCYMAFPDVQADKISDLSISMQLMTSSPGSRLDVGVMIDPYDISTFDSVTSVTLPVAKQWREIIIPLTSYKKGGRHIAVRTSPIVASDFSLDSIVIDKKSACSKIMNVWFTYVTDSSFEVKWSGDTEKQWDIVVSERNVSIDELGKSINGDVVSGVLFAEKLKRNSYNINDLRSNTTYYVYVRADCGSAGYGLWSDVVSVTTACRIVDAGTLGLEDFESCSEGESPACWTVGNLSTPGSKYNFPKVKYDCANSGIGSLFISSDIDNNGAYLISPQILVDDISKLQVSFWGCCTEDGVGDDYKRRLIVGVVTSVMDLSTFVPIDTVDGYKDGQYYTVSLHDYLGDANGDKGTQVMFLSEFDKKNWFYVDDIVFDTIPACPSPKSIKIDTVADTFALVEWTSGASLNSPYQVLVSNRCLSYDELYSVEILKDVLLFEESSCKVKINNLIGGTEYCFYIRGKCNGDWGAWSSPIRFKTACSMRYKLPYSYGFDDTETTGYGSLPECWTTYYNDKENENLYPYVDETGRNGSNSLYVFAYDTSKVSYGITPELQVEDLSCCQVSFYMKGNYSDEQRSLVVGVVENATCGDSIMKTFVPIDSFIGVFPDYAKYIVDLSGYKGKGKRIAFSTLPMYNIGSYGGLPEYGGVYIDDVLVEEIPSCPMPDYFMLKDISNDYVHFKFKEMGNAAKWQISYGAKNCDVKDGSKFIVSECDVNINGLLEKMDYDIYVRAICEEGDTSLWSGPYTVRTTGLPVSEYPYLCDFESDKDVARWTMQNGTSVNKWVISDTLNNSKKGALYISYNEGKTAGYLVDKSSLSWAFMNIELNKGEYIFEYDWSCAGEGKYDYMQIGLVPSSVTLLENDNVLMSYDGLKYTLYSYGNIPRDKWIPLMNNDNSSKEERTLLSGLPSDSTEHVRVRLVINEEMIGAYKLVCLWNNDSHGGEQPAAYIDNINISRNDCAVPVECKVETTQSTSLHVSWKSVNDVDDSVIILVTDNVNALSVEDIEADDFVKIDTVKGSSYIFEGLAKSTKYRVFVKSLCVGCESDWIFVSDIRTMCEPIKENIKFGFENEDGYYIESGFKRKHSNCFIYGFVDGNQLIPYNEDYAPYIVESSDKYKYSRTGTNAMVLTYNSSVSGGYVILPLIESSLDNKQLTFWMRACYHDKNTGVIMNYDLSDFCARKITVGTIDNPYDFSTYEELQICQYPYSELDVPSGTHISDDKNGNDFWVKYTVQLLNAKKYIVFVNESYGGYDRNTVYIDDITIEESDACMPIKDLKIDSVGHNEARILFNTVDLADKYVVYISESRNMNDTLRIDTLMNNDRIISGLEPAKEYYISVRGVCEDNVSDASLVVSFVTSNVISFDENFSQEIIIPHNWSRNYIGDITDLYDNQVYDYVSATDTVSWHRVVPVNTFPSHQIMKYRDANLFRNTMVLFTPVIYLPKSEKLHLVFDLALTASDNYNPIKEESKGAKDKAFYVVISEDGGITWNRNNTVSWGNNGNEAYVFDDIPSKLKSYDIDLSSYAGKNIKIAFVGESKDYSVSYDLHLANVHVNSYKQKHYVDKGCMLQDYSKYGFNISYKELKIGRNSLKRLSFSTSESDSIVSIDLDVNPYFEVTLQGVVCEGKQFTEYGFNTEYPGLTKRKLQAANGCDSVIVLNLDVIPAKRVEKVDSICVDGKYTWNGNEYVKPGVYSDTLTSKETGCDSIVTLTLLPIKEITVSLDTAICYGETLKIGEEEIVESGNHTVRLESVHGCDSVINVSLTILPEYRSTTNAVICKGESYSDDIFKGLKDDTFTKMTVDSKEKCDSTVTLNLVVIENGVDKEVTVDISVNDLPYRFFDKEFGQDTKPGTYTEEMELGNGNCKATVRLRLNVSDEVGYVPTRTVKELVLTPNPINAGEEVTVNAEFTEKELSDMTVEVYTSSGTKVMSFRPESEPVTISGLTVSGVYMVRITTGEGTVYQGKIVVR